jgi:hypothetical protein
VGSFPFSDNRPTTTTTTIGVFPVTTLIVFAAGVLKTGEEYFLGLWKLWNFMQIET